MKRPKVQGIALDDETLKKLSVILDRNLNNGQRKKIAFAMFLFPMNRDPEVSIKYITNTKDRNYVIRVLVESLSQITGEVR